MPDIQALHEERESKIDAVLMLAQNAAEDANQPFNRVAIEATLRSALHRIGTREASIETFSDNQDYSYFSAGIDMLQGILNQGNAAAQQAETQHRDPDAAIGASVLQSLNNLVRNETLTQQAEALAPLGTAPQSGQARAAQEQLTPH